MKHSTSRRQFLQAGLALPAAGLVSSNTMEVPSATPNGLTFRTLGNTGLKVTSVGCAAGAVPDPDILARALELGINYYDTARIYGQGKSEQILGKAIQGKRDKIVLASKTYSNTKAKILEDIETSLKTLGTDHLDIYHQHSRHTPQEITDEMIETMELVKKQGKTRFIGVSTHDPNAMVDFILKAGKFDVVQTTYSYAIGAPFRDAAIARLHKAGIGVVAMKVVIATATPKGDKGNHLSNEGGLAAIKWVLRNPGISTTVPWSETKEELEINFRAMTEEFTPADEKILFVRNEQIRELYCRMCFQCKGKCPKGVPVADELRFLAYNDFKGNFHEARESFWELPRNIRSIRCAECAECVVQCPNGVKVHERLIRAQELLA
ncbi:MAG: aldo/keto reductase [Acidobacteria bacterium]|nr:aldo/keto reductase [Acidobacteriota bacterium]